MHLSGPASSRYISDASGPAPVSSVAAEVSKKSKSRVNRSGGPARGGNRGDNGPARCPMTTRFVAISSEFAEYGNTRGVVVEFTTNASADVRLRAFRSRPGLFGIHAGPPTKPADRIWRMDNLMPTRNEYLTSRRLNSARRRRRGPENSLVADKRRRGSSEPIYGKIWFSARLADYEGNIARHFTGIESFKY